MVFSNNILSTRDILGFLAKKYEGVEVKYTETAYTGLFGESGT